MWVRVVVATILLLLPSGAFAQTEKRIGLLIGNKDYKAGVGALTNPLNDIRIVGEALKAVGFEVLKPVENAQRSAMLIAIHAFAAKLKAAGPDAVGFLYYSGHGIASAGENYLIPTDVDEPSTVQLSVQGVKQSEVLGILRGEAPNAAHYLVLDACRHTLQGARGGKGFVPVGQQSGVLVAFAAEPGKTASDIGQGSGPYAAALATELVKPGQSDLIMFHRVRVAVIDKTKGDQVPWTEDGIQRRQRVLFGGEAKATPSSPLRLSEAAEAWDRSKDGTSVAVLEAFIARYKDTFYADLARARIADLKKQKVTSSASKREQPTTLGGMLQCEAYSDRPVCEFDPSCAWVDNGRRCERKSGSLATAMLEASPASKPTLLAPCQGMERISGIEALVGNEKRCLMPGESFKDCPECPELVVVPAGEFIMGSPADEEGRESIEGPQHKVRIGKPFGVGKFETTFAEWDACVTGGGCKHKPSDNGWGRGKRAVSDVSWDAITKEFLPWLSRKTGKTYRLLTEAEWEYAARAGSAMPFSTGMTISPEQANFDGRETFRGSAKGQYRQRPIEVGSFQANAFGLHDLHGNVWEWVEDCYKNSYAGAPSDGSAVVSGDCSMRVMRGGSWASAPRFLRAASRSFFLPDLVPEHGTKSLVPDINWGEPDHGFRLARTLSP